MKQVTDLTMYYKDNFKSRNIVKGAWLITDGDKKQIVVKFNDTIPKVEREIRMRIIACKFMETAADEDEKRGGKSSFGDLIDGMQFREWKKEDDEAIKNGIPHKIVKEEEKER